MRRPLPAPPRERAADYPTLTGGLNLRDLNYRLHPSQSPYMKNMWWKNGILQCRDGQNCICEGPGQGRGYTACPDLFWGHAFFHIGSGLYYGNPEEETMALTRLLSEIPEERGTFFQYDGWLFYKNRGGFFRITYRKGENPPFSAERAQQFAYTPVIQINSDPETGAGDPYQPENRISARKTVWYTPKPSMAVFHLPVKPVDGVCRVVVDGTELTPDQYTVNGELGLVTLSSPPAVTDPPAANTVEITLEQNSREQMNSVMDCRYAMVSGGARNICILMAGSEAQPNAVFWNANDHLSMNPGYWPVTAYNLVGATDDPVTGFGRQYSDTMVFKQHSVGKLAFAMETLNGRNVPLFTYTNINDRIGCDLPWTIQLVQNNLVFCNTAQGVHVVRSSSAALENNIELLSEHVNPAQIMAEPGDDPIPGLLQDVRRGETVVSWDDDSRYWLCANGHAYLWDYTVSGRDSPCWYFLTQIRPEAFFRDREHHICHLGPEGRITRLERTFSDYGQPIEKVYRFPVSHFGSYERLKDVTRVLLSTRSDTPCRILVRYDTDYESRMDPTAIQAWQFGLGRMALNRPLLGYYSYDVPKYARVACRTPGCRHIRHFSMTLSNRDLDADMAVVSAQVFYRFSGKER